VWSGTAGDDGRQADGQHAAAGRAGADWRDGARTNEVFSQSIDALYGTVLNTALRDNSLLTSLLVDLLDRNLYERANDCRWWALTPQLSELLEAQALGRGPGSGERGLCAAHRHSRPVYGLPANHGL
jgi:hypothetical protein